MTEPYTPTPENRLSEPLDQLMTERLLGVRG